MPSYPITYRHQRRGGVQTPRSFCTMAAETLGGSRRNFAEVNGASVAQLIDDFWTGSGHVTEI